VVIGNVVAIHNHGAGDIVEVQEPEGGDTFLFPFTRAVVPAIHIADGYLVIAPPLDAEPGEEEPD
jgi:16S rRNA processing protein RimM